MELQSLDIPISRSLHALVRLVAHHVVYEEYVSRRAGVGRREDVRCAGKQEPHPSQCIQDRVTWGAHPVAREEMLVTVVGSLHKGVCSVSILFGGGRRVYIHDRV